jgi:hypothetical protein
VDIHLIGYDTEEMKNLHQTIESLAQVDRAKAFYSQRSNSKS